MILHKKTILAVSARLGLKISDDKQDWAIELADRYRVIEFLKFLSMDDLFAEEKYAIFSLALSSYDDYLQYSPKGSREIEKEITKVLDKSNGQFDDLLNYWACGLETDSDMYFKITPFIRLYTKLKSN